MSMDVWYLDRLRCHASRLVGSSGDGVAALLTATQAFLEGATLIRDESVVEEVSSCSAENIAMNLEFIHVIAMTKATINQITQRFHWRPPILLDEVHREDLFILFFCSTPYSFKIRNLCQLVVRFDMCKCDLPGAHQHLVGLPSKRTSSWNEATKQFGQAKYNLEPYFSKALKSRSSAELPLSRYRFRGGGSTGYSRGLSVSW